MNLLRLFAPSADLQLTPERLGLRRHQTLVTKVIEHKGPYCAFSGVKAPVTRRWPDGGMRVEVIDPKKPVGRVANLRLVDPMVYWSRHVDQALDQGQGDLIFAPWFNQVDILTMMRTALMAAHFAQRANSTAHQDISESILANFRPLAADGLLLEALGLEGHVDRWNPKQWLEALGQTPVRQRRSYVKALVKNIRFLPNETAHREWVAHLGDNVYLEGDDGPGKWLHEQVKSSADVHSDQSTN